MALYWLNRELNGGAWCPERQISKDVLEYLEVYLPTLHVISAVATQGRFGNGQDGEYTEDYALSTGDQGSATGRGSQTGEENR
ncbi:hypothetical protein CEXT_399871 [Caerostris extrusa]|uniref:F5/8 type C domain-containing protein n=1 Tax=Caerostris extrusa TaxID=172846 RepID=A0AAV4N7L7_CAEEX|nr:hypothetical protein CEXT_399871 [Caerostris extrusa]